MATPRIPTANTADVEHLVDTVLDGRPTVKTQELGAAFHLDYTVIKRAAAEGLLPVVRVSPRRIVVTRDGMIAYLSRLNDIDAEGAA